MQSEGAFLILKFFDAYVAEVRKHMDYEDMNVFTYVENLVAGNRESGFRISQFARRHDQIDAKLKELKNIIIKYYPLKIITAFHFLYCSVSAYVHIRTFL